MSTEQQTPPPAPAPTPAPAPAPVPKAEPNALAASLNTGWEQFKQGKLISYPMMALILVVVAGIGVTWWIIYDRRKAESAKWVELEGQTTLSGLEEFAKKNPNTIQAKLADLEVARGQLGPEGIDRITTFDPTMRKTAIASIEKARDSFAKLVDEFKDDPVIRVECMLACAKAEAVLVGMPKEGQLTEFRGDPKKAIEWLDKVAEAAPDTDWGKDSKKLADTLRNLNTQEQVVKLQASVYLAPTTTPKMPFGPQMPLSPDGSMQPDRQ